MSIYKDGYDAGFKQGLEDALELCLSETETAPDKNKALERIQSLLALIKEDKLDQLKRKMGAILQ